MANKNKVMSKDISFGKLKDDEKIAFAKHLAIMLKSGLTISEALDIIRNQAKGRLKNIVTTVMKSVLSGRTLSSSLEKFPRDFSPLFINTVMVGESSGNLEDNLDYVSEHLKKNKELMEKIKSAMIYPVIVLVFAFILGMALSFLVLPKIIPMFKGLDVELPITTRMLISFTDFIDIHGRKLFIGIISFVVFILWFAKRKFAQPITHFLLLKSPLIGTITRNKNLSTFANTLGTLLRSGLNIDEALEISRKTVDNYYFKKYLRSASVKTQRGLKLSDILENNKKIFPGIATSMIRIGERSGKLEDTLLYLAEHFENEVDTATKRLSTAIEPILLIFIGLVVGGLAISIITPIYKITGSAGV